MAYYMANSAVYGDLHAAERQVPETAIVSLTSHV